MEVGAHNFTVNYASRRSEIWRWYWRAWGKPSGLWRVHVFLGVGCGLVYTLLDSKPFDLGLFFTYAVVYTVGFIVLFPLWPQIRFKSAVRSLTISSEGLVTSIGKITSSRSWTEVASVEERSGAVVITVENKNAFIVPSRAFDSRAELWQFFDAAERWCRLARE